MKVKDIIKKQTTIIAIAVVLVAASVIGVSYAIFFSVGENKNDQVITAGVLKMTISGVSRLDLSEPRNNDFGKTNNDNKISYKVQNTASDVAATYQIYIYSTATTNPIELSKVKISLDGATVQALTSLQSENITINGVETTCYKIGGIQTIAEKANAETKEFHIWLDEDLMNETDAGKNIDLNLYIVSEV